MEPMCIQMTRYLAPMSCVHWAILLSLPAERTRFAPSFYRRITMHTNRLTLAALVAARLCLTVARHSTAKRLKRLVCAISPLGTATINKHTKGQMSSRFSSKEGKDDTHTLYYTLLSS